MAKNYGARAGASFPAGDYCLVKGSPEAVAKLLAPGAKPDWFDATYYRLAERGMRVLGLAYRHVPDMRAQLADQFGLTSAADLPPPNPEKPIIAAKSGFTSASTSSPESSFSC